VKSADRARAEIGDTITYRIEVHNPTAANLNNVIVSDRLPESFIMRLAPVCLVSVPGPGNR